MPTVAAPPRIKLRNILFATDLSSSAPAVLSHAADLARRYGAVLYTVHVLPHMPFVEATGPGPEQAEMLANEQMPALMNSASLQGIEHKELIVQGEVSKILSRLVRERGIDLILMGTGGRKGLGKLLLGSVAEEVFRNAECPVITMGPHATRWGTDGKLEHILFATDFGPESLHGLPYAISLAEENRARLTLLHVAPEPGVTMPEFLPMIDPRERVAYTKHHLCALLPEVTQLSHDPQCIVEFGPAAATIVKIATLSTDMIVMGVKRPAALTKHLGEGVAYQVICNAPCPVLTVSARYHG
ncbi:MAG: universal stress protein [Terriglobales bacterium]